MSFELGQSLSGKIVGVTTGAVVVVDVGVSAVDAVLEDFAVGAEDAADDDEFETLRVLSAPCMQWNGVHANLHSRRYPVLRSAVVHALSSHRTTDRGANEHTYDHRCHH